MSNFNFWYNNIADMPTRDEEGWYDLETGLRYDHGFNYEPRKPRFKANEKTKNARDIAKSFGGKALKGTSKQKVWAEEIRANVLKSVNEVQAEILCYLTIFETAKFWIENRNMPASQIGENAEKTAELLKRINKLLREAEKSLVTDQFRNIIDDKKYNELMTQREQLIKQLNSLFVN